MTHPLPAGPTHGQPAFRKTEAAPTFYSPTFHPPRRMKINVSMIHTRTVFERSSTQRSAGRGAHAVTSMLSITPTQTFPIPVDDPADGPLPSLAEGSVLQSIRNVGTQVWSRFQISESCTACCEDLPTAAWQPGAYLYYAWIHWLTARTIRMGCWLLPPRCVHGGKMSAKPQNRIVT
jgi:hypothetical protein